MGGLAPWHLIIIAIVVLLVFGGRGKLSGVMGDAAKGIRAFRDGLKDEPAPTAAQPTPPVAPLPHVEPQKDEAPR